MQFHFIMSKKINSNGARSFERKQKNLKKNVDEAWNKNKNPNLFAGWSVTDPQGKIISVKIAAYGHVAKLFEKPSLQRKLEKAFRRNNADFTGLDDEDLDESIKNSVESQVPEPPLPIFLMKSYDLQTYLSTLIR